MLISVTATSFVVKITDDLERSLAQLSLEIAARKDRSNDHTPVQVIVTLSGSFTYATEKKAEPSEADPIIKKLKMPFIAEKVQTGRTVFGKLTIEGTYTLNTSTGEEIVNDIYSKIKSVRRLGFIPLEPAAAED